MEVVAKAGFRRGDLSAGLPWPAASTTGVRVALGTEAEVGPRAAPVARGVRVALGAEAEVEPRAALLLRGGRAAEPAREPALVSLVGIADRLLADARSPGSEVVRRAELPVPVACDDRGGEDEPGVDCVPGALEATEEGVGVSDRPPMGPSRVPGRVDVVLVASRLRSRGGFVAGFSVEGLVLVNAFAFSGRVDVDAFWAR